MNKFIYLLTFSFVGVFCYGQNWQTVGTPFSDVDEKVIEVNDYNYVGLLKKSNTTGFGTFWLFDSATDAWTEVAGGFNGSSISNLDIVSDGIDFYFSYTNQIGDVNVWKITPGGVATNWSSGIPSGFFGGATDLNISVSSNKLYLAGGLWGLTDIGVLEYSGAVWDTLSMNLLVGAGISPSSISDVSAYASNTKEYVGISYVITGLDKFLLLESNLGSGTFTVASGVSPSSFASTMCAIAGDGFSDPIIVSNNITFSDSVIYLEYTDGTGYTEFSGLAFSGAVVENIDVSFVNGKKMVLASRNSGTFNTNVFKWFGGAFVDVQPSGVGIGNISDAVSDFTQHPISGKPYAAIEFVSDSLGVFGLNVAPFVESTTVQSICPGGGTFITQLKIKDMDRDSLTISAVSSDQGVIADGDIQINHLSTIDTLKYFEVYINSTGNAGTAIIDFYITDGITQIVYNEGANVNVSTTIDYSAIQNVPICTSNGAVDPSNLIVPMGGDFSGTSIVNGVIDPVLAITDNNIFYELYDINGCYASTGFTVNAFDGPELSVGPGVTPASCGMNDGTAEVNLTTGTSDDYLLTWSTGDTTILTVTDLSAGQYVVDVIDTNGCTTFITLTVPMSDILVSTNTTNPSCAGASDGGIDITVSGTAPFTYYWINGQATEDITNLGEGVYDVTITDANGCQASEVITLTANSSTMTMDAGVDLGSCGNTDCVASILTMYGGNSPYTFLWSNGQTSQNLMAVAPGVYSVIVTDANGCTMTETFTVSIFDGPSIELNSLSDVNCNMSDGAVDLNIFGIQNSISTISWSNGASTEDLTGLNPGIFTVVVTDVAGCEAQETYEVEAIKPIVQPICFVTVDSLTTTNLLIWERTVLTGISHYNIYRETGLTNNYVLVGTVNATDESAWNDINASPLVTSWRYKMTQVDDCGTESNLSAHHKTMHVTINQGVGTNFNIFWDQYEGIIYPSVNLYRFDALNGLVTLATLPSNVTSYTDNPGLDTIGIDYFVGFDLPQPCVSTRATSYNGTRSNRSAGVFDPGNGVGLSINEFSEISDLIQIYPNPNNGHFTIDFGNSIQGEKIVKVLDARGRVIVYKKTNSGKLNLNLSYIENGMYFVEVLNNKDRGIKKLIKN